MYENGQDRREKKKEIKKKRPNYLNPNCPMFEEL